MGQAKLQFLPYLTSVATRVLVINIMSTAVQSLKTTGQFLSYCTHGKLLHRYESLVLLPKGRSVVLRSYHRAQGFYRRIRRVNQLTDTKWWWPLFSKQWRYTGHLTYKLLKKHHFQVPPPSPYVPGSTTYLSPPLLNSLPQHCTIVPLAIPAKNPNCNSALQFH